MAEVRLDLNPGSEKIRTMQKFALKSKDAKSGFFTIRILFNYYFSIRILSIGILWPHESNKKKNKFEEILSLSSISHLLRTIKCSHDDRNGTWLISEYLPILYVVLKNGEIKYNSGKKKRTNSFYSTFFEKAHTWCIEKCRIIFRRILKNYN